MKSWLYLSIAIVAEVIATSALKASDGFTKPWPLLLVIVGYATAFVFLSLTLRQIPIGVTYAIWSGVGIVLISLVGWVLFGQKLDLPAVVGMALVVGGILVMNVFSKTTVH